MRIPTRVLAILLPAILTVACFAPATSAKPDAGPQRVPAPILRTTIADGPLMPESHYGDIAALVRDVIGRLHYSSPTFDQELSSSTLDRYIQSLDPNRSYFLASDIAEFDTFRGGLVERRGTIDLNAAFVIYNRFHQRVMERVAFLDAQLEEMPDFSVDEEYQYDRTDAPWATSVAELDEITRKRFKNDALTLLLTDIEWAQVVETLERRYRNLGRRSDQTVASDVFQLFMNALTTSIDPHTSYLTPAAQDNFRIDMSLSLEGIGAVLSAEDDYTRVVSIVAAGPADNSKAIFPEDRILGIAQGVDGEFVDVVGWRIDDVVGLIRGPRDTIVRLMVLPANAPPDAAPKTVTLERKKIRLEEQAASSKIIEVERDGRTQRIGVIDLPTFYADFNALQAGDPNAKSTTRDVSRLLDELKTEGVDAVVMDLRGNGGGSLVEATDLAALFIGEGPVVQIRDGEGSTQVSRNRGAGAKYTGPFAVLIDRRSASGSEIFAGVIQDYGRGLIIGARSYGKGTVQQLIPLDRFSRGDGPRLGELKLTIAKFYRVNGSSNQHKGIIPDIELPSPFEGADFGEAMRPTALPWDEIAPTGYRAVGEMDKLAARLAALHTERASDDPGFSLLKREFGAYREARARTMVSLNRDARMQDSQMLEREQLAMENERRALRGEPPLGGLDELDRTQEQDDFLLDETAEIMVDMILELRRREIVQASAAVQGQ
ncbi:MAG: carboxy terminal-processing peptidase [Gammaproteobacteria bacterium]